jgi:hypothetical protein
VQSKFRAGDLVRYNHAKGYAGFRLGNGWDKTDTHIRDNEVFLIIKADPNKIIYFNDIGHPRFAYTIMMVSVINTIGDRQRNKLLAGQIFEVVLDDCDGDEYLTLLASV